MTTLITHLVAAALLVAAATSPAFAVTPDRGAAATSRTPSEAQARQQTRMARCNQEATGQKGDARKAFMKQCLSSAKAAPPTDAGAKASRSKAAR